MLEKSKIVGCNRISIERIYGKRVQAKPIRISGKRPERPSKGGEESKYGSEKGNLVSNFILTSKRTL